MTETIVRNVPSKLHVSAKKKYYAMHRTDAKIKCKVIAVLGQTAVGVGWCCYRTSECGLQVP